MNRLALVLIVVLAPAIAHADKVYAVGKGGTWNCKNDPVVTINHGRGVYTFQGPCKTIQLNGGESTITVEDTDELNVNGGSNTITVGAVDQINVVGAHNKVTWRKAKHGDQPHISAVGANNKIEGGGAAADKPAADKPAADKPAPDRPAGGKSTGDKNAIDCAKQPSHTINTGDNTLTYVGTCERIVINGGDNRLTIENVKQLTVNGGDNVVDIGGVDRISINGEGNKITYKKGLSGAKPHITSMGEHNDTTQVK